MTAEKLIQILESRSHFFTDVDGFVYYGPAGMLALNSWTLRTIADELDRRNAAWEAQIKQDLEEPTNAE